MIYSVIEVSAGGYVWEIDASAIAKARADYYVRIDPETTYQEEFEYAITDSYTLTDWYSNNMDWDDVSDDDKRLVYFPDHATSPDDFDSRDIRAR